MANYIAHYTKKQLILTRREQDLRRLVQRDASIEKLIVAAERVRQSRTGVLKAHKANPPPEYRQEPKKFAEIGPKIQALQEMPVEAILAEFGVDVPQDKTTEQSSPDH